MGSILWGPAPSAPTLALVSPTPAAAPVVPSSRATVSDAPANDGNFQIARVFHRPPSTPPSPKASPTPQPSPRPAPPVVALIGDGAMQMNGLLELITVAHRWRQWEDPRFVILVLHNRDLSEVSWEQREMEGDPRFPDSQSVPGFPYADYAELLGLQGIRVTTSAEAPEAWRAAFRADRPTVIEAVVYAAVPLLPPNLPDEKAAKVFDAVSQEPDGGTVRERVEQHLKVEQATR